MCACECVCARKHICVCMCVCVCVCICLPDSIIHHFQCKYGLAFSMSLLFPPSFVYYLLCWGSQCLVRRESRVAIMSLRGCHNYVLLQTHRKKVLAVRCSTQCCRVRHICLPCVSALIAGDCRLHYFTNNRQRRGFQMQYLSVAPEWISVNISSKVFSQSAMVMIHSAPSVHVPFFFWGRFSHTIHVKFMSCSASMVNTFIDHRGPPCFFRAHAAIYDALRTQHEESLSRSWMWGEFFGGPVFMKFSQRAHNIAT